MISGGIVGVLLAGGRSSRMGGGDKCLRLLGGRTILERVIARARDQVEVLVLNAGGDPARFAAFGLAHVPDVIAGHAGPLAGILTGLEWMAERRPGARWLASFATDAPFFPLDLVERLLAAVEGEGADLAAAASGGRAHPVFGLWPVRLRGELRRAMVEEDLHKIDLWTARYRLARAEYASAPIDPFFNVNRPEDLAEAERLIETAAGAARAS